MLRTAVRGASHLDNLQKPQQMAHPFGIAHDDDAVGDGFFHAKRGPVCILGGRSDLGDEDGGAAEGRQFFSRG